MKEILCAFLLFIFNLSYAQEFVHVKGKSYQGYIFPKEHFVFNSIDDQKERYTPTLEDIIKVETILADSINFITNKEQPYRYSLKPIINKKTLKKYKRQYVGFLDKNNNVIIWINFLLDKSLTEEDLKSDIIRVLDGRGYYWNIYINIGTNELSYMYVNGTS